jgi:subtilisin family serine protease
MRDNIVLRNLADGPTATRIRTRDLAGPFESFGLSARAAAPPQPGIEIYGLNSRELADIRREPRIAAVAPIMLTSLIRPVPGYDVQEVWGLTAVKADTSRFTGEGVTVAVLDTGIDTTHPAFAGKHMILKDFTATSYEDKHGHGTHCAGTIFGGLIEGKRIGIAPGVSKVLIGKVLDDAGNGTSDMMFAGIQWAIEQGAHVISLSLRFDFPRSVDRMVDAGWPIELATSASLEAYRANLRMLDAMTQMIRARAAFGYEPMLIAASGNESKREINSEYKVAPSLPVDGIVSVGALQRKYDLFEVSPFSSFFPDVSAPGVNILSTLGGGLGALSGTSMACAHVAGVAALWWESLRKAGGVIPSGKLVVDRLHGSARVDVFASNVEPGDRGYGLVTAPQ